MITCYNDTIPKNQDHNVYYIAQRHYFSQLFDESIIYYKRFINLYDESSTCIDSSTRVKLIDSYIKIGKYYSAKNNLHKAFKYIWTAYEYGDTIDPLLVMAEQYIHKRRHPEAYYMLKSAYSSIKYCKDKSDIRKQEHVTFQYNVLMSRSTESLYKYEECYNSCQDALKFLYNNPLCNLNRHNTIGVDVINRPELTAELVYRHDNNRKIMFKESYREYSSKQVILFYCEPYNYIKKWNGFSIRNSMLEDSQISIILLAEELQRHHYKVIVCCDTEERVYCNDVEYIRISDYDYMLKHYILDHLVLSRYSNFLKCRPNVKNIYLWYHTFTPDNIYIDMDESKLKNIIVMSEYHRTRVLDNIPLNFHPLTMNINYSIIQRQSKTDLSCKIPLRFIYLMYPNQYADKLIELFIKIRNIYHKATIDIFLMVDSPDLHSKIAKFLPQGIYVHSESNRQKITEKMICSDYWIYSSCGKVERAYCLYALEAQASGCICIYPAIGSLPEIIANRGVKIDSSDDEEIISSLCFLEENIYMKDDLRHDSLNWALSQTYKHRVLDWISMFDSVEKDLNIYI